MRRQFVITDKFRYPVCWKGGAWLQFISYRTESFTAFLLVGQGYESFWAFYPIVALCLSLSVSLSALSLYHTAKSTGEASKKRTWVGASNADHLNGVFYLVREYHKSMDEGTIKTQNPKCRLYWCLIGFIDWRYSRSCWYFWPILWTVAPIPSLWHILEEFNHKVLTYVEYRAVSGVFQNIDPPSPFHQASVSSPRTAGRWGGGGSIF